MLDECYQYYDLRKSVCMFLGSNASRMRSRRGHSKLALDISDNYHKHYDDLSTVAWSMLIIIKAWNSIKRFSFELLLRDYFIYFPVERAKKEEIRQNQKTNFWLVFNTHKISSGVSISTIKFRDISLTIRWSLSNVSWHFFLSDFITGREKNILWRQRFSENDCHAELLAVNLLALISW